MENVKLDNVKEAIGSVCKRKRWQSTFRDIIRAKRLNPNKAIDNRAAFGFVLVLTSNGIISSESGKTKPLLSVIFER